MLKLTIPSEEYYNELTNEFVYTKSYELQLEHSLVSISKWESKWKRAFLSDKKKSYKEMCDYVRCMTITQNVPPRVFIELKPELMQRVEAYMEDPMTATVLRKMPDRPGPKEAVTSELIYYWMIQLGIPFSCEKWHINRLMTLIQVCSRKNGGGKSVPKKDMAAEMAALNKARRAKYHTRG